MWNGQHCDFGNSPSTLGEWTQWTKIGETTAKSIRINSFQCTIGMKDMSHRKSVSDHVDWKRDRGSKTRILAMCSVYTVQSVHRNARMQTDDVLYPVIDGIIDRK